MNGIAIWLTWVPNSEIVAAVHSFAKSGLRGRLRAGSRCGVSGDRVADDPVRATGQSRPPPPGPRHHGRRGRFGHDGDICRVGPPELLRRAAASTSSSAWRGAVESGPARTSSTAPATPATTARC